MSQGPETVLMGGPLDIGMLFLPDATTGRCDDCSTKIVYRANTVTAELATVCVPCAAKRLRANPETPATKKLINWLDEALKRRKAEIERELSGVPQVGDRVIVRNPRGAATFEGTYVRHRKTRRGKSGWFEVKSDDGFTRSARPSMCTRVDSPLPIRPSRS